MKKLLAKSLPKQPTKCIISAAKYTGHISFVLLTADILIKKLGKQIIKQLGLHNIDLEYFANTVRLAAYLHDWGKANQHFQEMVRLNSQDERFSNPKTQKKLREMLAEHDNKQMLRHEVISGILALGVPSFRQWLKNCPNADFEVAVWAAIGHHLKIDGEKFAEIPSGTGTELKIYTEHEDFKRILKLGEKLGLPNPDYLELPAESWTKEKLAEKLEAICDEFAEISETITFERQKFIAAVKATVIAADLAGSALPESQENLRKWMEEVLGVVLLEDDIDKVLDKRLEGKGLRSFQQQIANAKNRVTLVKAGCGTGKTIGAYGWAKKWAVNHKLFFCYPTTGTATQGFIDYALSSNIEADLMHSRADLDRDLLFSNEADDSESIEARLVAMQAWRQKLIVCTVDTVLGLIQNNRRPLYCWAAIAQGAFVFDEVHAYDDNLFAALLWFLKTFTGAPILLMSASFTPQQIEAIQKVISELGEEIEIIPGIESLENLPRYQIQTIDSETKAWDAVRETVNKGQKVLWVTNSVKTCIELYEEAKKKLPIQPLIYHSRFRYFDRAKKHEAVVNAFHGEGAVFAVTTQVCEMSLDLSADLLVSALAPAPALIQRMGRLNRKVTEVELGKFILDSGRICTCLVYPWSDYRPYEPEELATGKDLVESLAGKEISQQDLALEVEKISNSRISQVQSAWLQGDWCTRPAPLRKAGYTITVLLQDDLADIKANQNGKSFMKAAQKFTVPIRIMKDFRDWKRIKLYPVAPPTHVEYSAETGAKELCN
jgi:CRISPR-associated endonuclease/helicase Cas3